MRADTVRAGQLARRGRVPDRRRGVAALLSAVTSGFGARRDVRALRERFEIALRTLLSAKAVTLREDAAASVPGDGSIAVPVPAPAGEGRPRLEVVLDRGGAPDEWSYQFLSARRRMHPAASSVAPTAPRR